MGIGFAPKGGVVKEGFQGEASIVFQKKENVLSIPLSAIRYLEGKEHVLVSKQESSTGEVRALQVGLRTEDEAEVISGVHDDEFVIIDLN